MKHSPDDADLRELVQGLRRADERRTPDFDDVVRRPLREPDGLPARGLQLAIVCCAVTMLFVAFAFVRSQPGNLHRDGERNRGDRTASGQATDSAHGATGVAIDFDRLRGAVDQHFRSAEAEAVAAPEWSTRTDSLLAVNLNIPPSQE